MRTGSRAVREALVIAAIALTAAACGSQGDAAMTGADATTEPASVLAGRVAAPTSIPAPSPSTVTPATVAPIPEPVAPETPPTTSSAPVERSGAEAVEAAVSDPVAIHIPSIGVDSALVATGVLDDGTVAVPPDANLAGWFNGGPRPGERGPAVIMGHVDSARTGPGVFFRLRDIAIGDVVTIDTPDRAIEFVVERIEQHPKLEFPTSAVYGPTPGPTLRLVTCGGSFDRSVRSYYDNIIVFLLPRSTP